MKGQFAEPILNHTSFPVSKVGYNFFFYSFKSSFMELTTYCKVRPFLPSGILVLLTFLNCAVVVIQGLVNDSKGAPPQATFLTVLSIFTV